MPDVLSIALGGGCLINLSINTPSIDSRSVGKALATQALCFGGTKLTLTDVALAMGNLKIPLAQHKQIPISSAQGDSIFEQIKCKINDLILKIQGEEKNLPLIFVGGGSALLPADFFKGQYQSPAYYDVANAYGAALAEISGTVDTVVSLQNREEALEEIYEEAKQKAVAQGANSTTLRLVDQQIISYSYIPNQMARVIVRYCGKRKQI